MGMDFAGEDGVEGPGGKAHRYPAVPGSLFATKTVKLLRRIVLFNEIYGRL